jgi:calpain
MAFKDFQSNFQKVEVCNLGPDCLTEELAASMQRTWVSTNHDGQWVRRVNAGGCRNYLDTFWTNPQYRISVTDPDEGDDEDSGTIIIGLMQKERRKKRSEGLDLLTIGYVIYKLKEDCGTGPLEMKFFKYNASVAKSPSFINMREICGRHKLPPGDYCIVPSTFEPNEEADFLLRVFSEKSQGDAGYICLKIMCLLF